MKYITLFFILFTTICYSQTLKGIVTLNPLRGIGDETQLTINDKKPIFFSYLYSNRTSKQELISKGGVTIDTILVNYEELNDLKLEKTEITVKPSIAVHYKNFNNNIYRFESEKIDQNLVKKSISIKDSIPVYEWNLVDESQTIAGYLCKKATTTKKIGRLQAITVWYCEDIPINDGPFDFSGLPGLILQIDIDNSSTLKFEDIKYLKEVNTAIDAPLNETDMITMAEYLRKISNGR